MGGAAAAHFSSSQVTAHLNAGGWPTFALATDEGAPSLRSLQGWAEHKKSS